ncbi:MAG: rhodanese-like domain-containing protein [Myxococcales bacterium]|nr:rhodanese-like domain-containing protein [Myxococcales bacterium]
MNRINGQQARAEVEAGAVLLDVRTPAEFASGSIPGAKNVPLDRLASRIGELDKEKKVVVFCRSGNRSATAAGILRRHGFTALDLGPVSAW